VVTETVERPRQRKMEMRFGWAGQEARTEETRNAYNVYIYFFENLKGRDHLEDLSVDRKIILEWILGK